MFNISDLHANMHGYRKEIIKRYECPNVVEIVAAKCFFNALEKVPVEHELMDLFCHLGDLVVKKESEQTILAHMKFLTETVGNMDEQILRKSSAIFLRALGTDNAKPVLPEILSEPSPKIANVYGKDHCYIEYTIDKWSKIKLTEQVPVVALYSVAKPLKAWDRKFWLRIEKGRQSIGLYLCCEADKDWVRAPSKRRSFSIAYQFLVIKPDLSVILDRSKRFPTEFKKDGAWGLSKFQTLEKLEACGGYTKAEDKITFACLVSIPEDSVEAVRTSSEFAIYSRNDGSSVGLETVPRGLNDYL